MVKIFHPRTLAAALALTLAACGPQAATDRSTATRAAATPVSGPPAKQLFGAAQQGSKQRSQSYGGYARGCQAGAVALAESGPTWQAMRLSRNRYWAQPATVDYVKDLSRKVARLPGWEGLYIGDMSQPRGGPMLTGHRSHQTGLDIDI